MKLSIISQTCNSDPAAALVGFADREGWFPHCDVANAERLPGTLVRARPASCEALQERRSAIASGTQRPGRGGGPLHFIDDLPTQFAAYSKPAAELIADISASCGQTRWFCCAEEWRCAGPRTSLCGHGDLLFVGITAEFLQRQREVAERALKLEPIASVCLGIPGAPCKDMRFAAAAAEMQSEAALAFKSGSRRLQISGLAAEIEATLSRSAQRKWSADALSLPVATAASRLTAHATSPSCAPLVSLFGVQRMLTTWTYYPLPMTPAHAAVVRDMARVMAGILPMQVRPVNPPRFPAHASTRYPHVYVQGVEAKHLTFTKDPTKQHHWRTRLDHLAKVDEQAGQYGALVRRDVAQDPLLGPMNAGKVREGEVPAVMPVVACVQIACSGSGLAKRVACVPDRCFRSQPSIYALAV